MNDEVLVKILEALESINKRLTDLEARLTYFPYTPQPREWPMMPAPTPTWRPLFEPTCTDDPLPDLPTTTCETTE